MPTLTYTAAVGGDERRAAAVALLASEAGDRLLVTDAPCPEAEAAGVRVVVLPGIDPAGEQYLPAQVGRWADPADYDALLYRPADGSAPVEIPGGDAGRQFLRLWDAYNGQLVDAAAALVFLLTGQRPVDSDDVIRREHLADLTARANPLTPPVGRTPPVVG
jgi:hypothetical protein